LKKKQFFKSLKRKRRPFEPVQLKGDLNEEERAILAVHQFELRGSLVTAKLLREYPLGSNTAHITGYVGGINEQELKTLDPLLYSGALVLGKSGIEKKYEQNLAGQPGYQMVEVNSLGRVMRELNKVDPVDGKDIYLYLDHRLQEKAYEVLEGEKGSVVLIEVDTGGILAMASAPSFDPNKFVKGISHKNYNLLTKSSAKPLFDRALLGQYPPGSTMKPVYGLAALNEGIIDEKYNIYDPGYFQLPNSKHKYRDWKRGGHGHDIHLNDAIIESCDTFFYKLSTLMPISIFHKYGTIFGIGEKTGIDMPHEKNGIMPSRDWKKRTHNLAWYPGDSVNASIGQGFTLATPLQLAVMTAGLANQGKIPVPRVARDKNSSLMVKKEVEIQKKYWNYVRKAMKDVVHDPSGTARRINQGIDYEISGKTGTVQVIGIKQKERYDIASIAKKNRDHALFIAYAPSDKPKVAIAIIIENGGSGSARAAPAAKEVIETYMNLYSINPNESKK
jgi:penicillin-binding protein 2